MPFLYERSGSFKLDISPTQENLHLENLHLEVFFNTQFNGSGNPNTIIEKFSRFGCSCTVDLTAYTCNVKEYQSLFTDYLII